MKHKYLWIFAALLLWCGCNEPEPVAPTPPPAKEATYVTLATTSIPTFTAQGGEAGVTFETDGAWTAKAGAAWCSVSPAQGKAGTVTLKVVVKANTSYEERTTNIVVKAGKVTKSVQVKQEAQEKPESYLKVLPDSFDVAWTGEVIRIDVDANVDYTVVMPQENWITEGEGSTPDRRIFVVAPNEGYDERSAEVVFANEQHGVRSTLLVTQQAKELLELISAAKIELKASARSFELKLRANGEPHVSCSVDWLSLKSQSQGDNYERTFVFDVDANQVGDQRYAAIQFYHKSLYLQVDVELKSAEGNGGIDDMPEHPL